MRVDDKDPGAGRAEERLLGRRAAVRVHRSMALAEGLIEEIAAGLCRFSYLRVIARALPRGWSAMRK
jgi:hypothetical protein